LQEVKYVCSLVLNWPNIIIQSSYQPYIAHRWAFSNRVLDSLLSMLYDRSSMAPCAQRAIAKSKHRSQWSVSGWVTKIYYLEPFRASEGTLSRWSRLHLQSLAPTPVSRKVDVRQAAFRKNNCQIFITT
jgi:hypothetical protein